MTSSLSMHLTHRRLRAIASRLSIAWLAALALTLGLASASSAVGTGMAEQLSGVSGTDGCVSKDGTAGQCGVQPSLRSPQAVAVSADGKHVYVAGGSGSSNNVLIFTRNKVANHQLSKGALINTGSADAGSAPHGVIVSPDGKHVYLSSNNTIYVFSRNAKNGALTSIGCVSKAKVPCATTAIVPQLNGPEGMDITKDGKYVYVAARALQGVIAFSRNKTSGILSPAGCVSEGGAADGCTALPGVGLKGATDVAVSPDAAHVYVTADGSHAVTSFKRNKSNGSLTQLTGADGCWSETGQDGGVGSLVCRDGRGLSGANGIAATADGKFIYVTSSGSSAIAIFSRDKKTGTLSQATGIAGCVSQNGEDGNVAGACTPADIGGLNQAQKVTVSQDGLTLYATASKSNAVSSFSRNTTTGALTQLNCVSSTDLACDTGVAFGGAQGIAITKDGKNVYSTAPKDDAVDTLARN